MNDLVLCPDCGDPIEERLDGECYHTGCCPHDHVEDVDGRDGAYGRRYFWCHDCGTQVAPARDEDGAYWEVAF